MKLAVSTLTCPAWPLERIIGVAAEYGIRGIEFRGLEAEIDVTRLLAFSVHLPKTLSALQKANLAICCLGTSVTLLSPVGDRWEEMLEECRRYAILAGESGARIIRIFGGRPPAGLSRQEALTLARRRLRQVVKICSPCSCRPLIQTHDAWSTAGEVLELLEGFDPLEAAVLWDVEGTCRRGEPPEQTAGRLAGFLAHVHWKDSRPSCERPAVSGVERPAASRVERPAVSGVERSVPALIGQGDLPLRDCRVALKAAGYSGWISLETEKRWRDDAPDPDKSIPHFAAEMRRSLPP